MPHTNQPAMIERKATALDPAGHRHEVGFQISAPSEPSNGFSTVTIRLRGLAPEPHTLFGSDAWHAIILAMKLAKDQVAAWEQLGWQFFWEQDHPDYADRRLSPDDMYEPGSDNWLRL